VALETPSHQVFPSPLRYPGGKGKLANFIKLVMVQNYLVGSEYVELYAGGSSVALSLLFEDYAPHIHINDVNRGVYAFWKVVLDDPDALCSRITKTKVTLREWERQHEIQRSDDADELDLAFSTFFLNRTNRSGIIQGGVIGGKRQTGKWKIDARWKPRDLNQRIEKIARFRKRISVTGLDAATYIGTILPDVPEPFLYLDPPYYGKGRGLYESFYEHADHECISRLVRALEAPWVVSYDAVPEIAALYDSVTAVRYGLRYTARERFEGSEIMFFGPLLTPPEVDRPAGVSLRMVEDARVAA
jgi:DNA adenine methylase